MPRLGRMALELLFTLIVPLLQLGVDQKSAPIAIPTPNDIIPHAGL